jgi:hypothetical protein
MMFNDVMRSAHLPTGRVPRASRGLHVVPSPQGTMSPIGVIDSSLTPLGKRSAPPSVPRTNM